jgi:hypothetical protein
VNYKILTLLLAVLSLETFAGDKKTHCVGGETVFFSCAIIGSEKSVSLCGATDKFGTPQWMQYRFGVVGRAEMEFPTENSGSLEKFGGMRQTAKAINLTILEVWFRVGAYDYLIDLVSGGDCDGECKDTNSLTVFKRGSHVATFNCSQPVVNNLWGLYGHISDDQKMRP